MTDTTCAAEMHTASGCMLEHPASEWACTPAGMVAIKPGFCDPEQRIFVKCMLAHSVR
jgi:hypothetical protein